MKKLKITHINTHDIAGGAAKVAWRLAEAQRNAGLDSKMLVGIATDRRWSSAFPPEADRSLQTYCRQQGQLFYEYQGSHRLIKNPQVQSADILHLHNLHGDYFNPFSISVLSHLKPVVWTLHDMQSITGHCAHSFDCTKWQEGCVQCPYLDIEPALKIDTASQLLADKKLIYDNSYLRIVTPSRWLKNKVEKSILKSHPVELIYNGVNTDIFRPYDKKQARKKWGIPENVFVIGAVGHGGTLTNQWKGGQYTQQALEILWKNLPGCVFVNIGANCKSSDSRIINIPAIHDENELSKAYSVLDIFLYTSIADNCPLVVLEALSCGVPIVTFATGGVPELVRNGLDGFVTAYQNVPELVRAVETLAVNRQLQDQFSHNSRQAAVTKFDHKIIAGCYENLYRNILQTEQSFKKDVRLFPLQQLPPVIKTPAFIEAEKTKAGFALQQTPQIQSIPYQTTPCDVSIVLATKNRAKLLDNMLSSLKAAAEGVSCEVIVIDGNSSDDTLNILHKHNITQVNNEEKYLGPGRHSWPELYNFGFSKARGTWAMYASDDIVFGKGSITRAVELLNRQKADVAGGIFFYRNTIAEPGWDQFGIDFTYGPKLLMNYGLVRLDDFKRANGLDISYKFYCADGDLCYKLYQSGKQLIPLPGCFVVHDNVLDMQKKINTNDSRNDIELYKQRWGRFVSLETPNPRRLLWQDSFLSGISLPAQLPQTDAKIKATASDSGILTQVRKLGLWNDGRPLRLHLGCGQKHLEGYINIDYPASEHTVQTKPAADVFADIIQLAFPLESVDEIRLHHVFEHFDRPTALALLCRWHQWLKVGGRLIIETPDMEAGIRLLQSGQYTYKDKQVVIRHLFGSHEADWAVHKDGWYGEKFQHILSSLKFDNIQIELSSWAMTHNVTVSAHKSDRISPSVLVNSARQILRDSMVDQSQSEERQWKVWCKKLDEKYDKGSNASAQGQKNIIGIIFSKDRAMQLDACIRSFEMCCQDRDTVSLRIIYKCSTVEHKQLYQALIAKYTSVQFVEEEDFKKDLLSNLVKFQYVLFVVDDNIFVNQFSISKIIRSLGENPDALGFSLRLGKNITRHYQSNSDQSPPQFISVGSDMLKYDWTTATKYFGYPLEVSSSVYRTGDILNIVEQANYQNPNMLEAELAKIKKTFSFMKRNLLCFHRSVAFCNPANIIQNTFADNRKSSKEDLSIENLAEMFRAGYRIDVEGLLAFVPSSCHQEIKFHFVRPQAAPGPVVPESPKVSIYMAVYNSCQYLAETIDSILNQTFSNFELVIADDGSTDGSLEILKNYQRRDSRVRIMELSHVGVVKARNETLIKCNPDSKYLMNHDSDDISLPDKLGRLVEYLDTHPQVAIVGCFAEYFGDANVRKRRPELEYLPERIRSTFGDVNSMIHSASLMRREVIEKIGGYREEFPASQDYDFFARALMAGFECANIPEVLHKIRLHNQSIGVVRREIQRNCAEKVRNYYHQYLQTKGTTNSGKTKAVSSRSSGDTRLSILNTVEFYAPHTGGAEEVIRQLSERLARRGHQVTVATTKLPERNFSELNGVEIKEFDVAGNFARGFQGKDINRYIDFTSSNQFDVMFNYAAQQWATDLAFISLKSPVAGRVNFIAPCGYSALSDAKTLRLPQFAKYFNEIIPAYLPKYDAAIYHSSLYKDYEYAQNHGFTNSIIIPNGTCEEEFSTRPILDFRQKYGISTKYLGLCVANFYPAKGHQRVIEAVRQMNRPDFTLVFVGKEGQLLPQLKAQAVGLNICFCVNIPREDTVAAYQSADLFLFGSEVEASPLVIIEAKASATPFITTDCGNVREWKGGVVCTPNKMASYANALLDNESARKQIAQEGWTEWKEKLTWESVVDQYEKLFLNVRQHKHRGSNACFDNIQQRPGNTVAGDHRLVSAALPG